MTTQHTPTPWFLRGENFVCGGNPDEAVADCEMGRVRKQDAANAAFIVRACNAHDELVAALRCIDAALNQNKTFPADVELARAECRAALAKVSK